MIEIDSSGLVHSFRMPMSTVRRSFDVELDGAWTFALVGSETELRGATWEEVQIPSLWTMSRPDDLPNYTNVPMPFDDVPPCIPARNPTGVYRRTARIERDGRRVILHVGAAEGHLRAYVNGVFAGTSGDSHLAAEFDITEWVRDGDNEIELRVAKWSAASYLEDQDQFWHSGLSRSVGLLFVPDVRLSDVVASADFDPETGAGTLRVEARVDALAGSEDPQHEIAVTLLGATHTADIARRVAAPTLPPPSRDRSVKPAQRFPDGAMDLLSINAAGGPVPPELRAIPNAAAFGMPMPSTPAGTARVELAGLEIEPWSAEQPVLYDLRVELRDAMGAVVDRADFRVGFRRVEIVGRDLLVNGARVLIQGVNRHDLDPATGRVISPARMHEELSLLKRANVNAIRCSHYPNDPAFYDLCDEYGFYVVDEADVEGHAFASTIADDPRYLTEIVDRVARMVRRDRNHPSIILWSLGNETGCGAAHDAAAAWVRHADPSRPVHYEGAISLDWHGGRAATDVVCPMYPSFAALESFSRDGAADRPLIACEYAYSQGNSTGGLADYWRLFETLPGLQGGFVWEFLDHALDPEGDARLQYAGDFGDHDFPVATPLNGIVTADLVPKAAYFEMRGVFSPVRLVSLDAASGRVTLRNRQAFADTTGLALEARVEGSDGPLVAVPISSRPIAAGAAATIALPDEAVRALRDPRAVSLSVRVLLAADAAWAPAGTELSVESAPLVRAPHPLPKGSSAPALDAVGDIADPLLAAPPRLSLWRALTDNDLAFALDNRFVRSGFFRLDLEDARIDERDDGALVELRYRSAFGDAVRHTRRIGAVGERDWVFDERVELPDGTRDGLRVGVELTLAPGFDEAAWTGLGPWENYPDRRAAAYLARHRLPIDDWPDAQLRPQETGTRGGVTELETTGPAGRALMRSATPLHASALRHSVDELESASHAWELPQSALTHIHLDIAHRGVGTGLLGPDTRPEHRPTGSAYEWSWRLTLES
ncbi:glycoside hydrolase family 2 TIM barrel-domain containing protein [Microbacterium halophytorum]|uniref:glycoside hydrolase family 2 TIM barrel-domain containing protein n=1 Tax=Microbacterium halophytorum TaxID=2067568 RepID=UPI000CFA8D4A|nr:glycoside hydrolase family 2 TIM barrel-domain containing protein [Microbacterium halophytorum]